MELLISGLFVLFIVPLVVPMTVLVVECCAALLPQRRWAHARDWPRPRIDVLIPAHNEAAVIEPTIRGLLADMAPEDRLWIVADNCSDATAEIARKNGALVVERHDPEHRGKGYALDYGLSQMAGDHREVVVIVDADCRVEPGALDHLARQAIVTGGPVQGAYRMLCPSDPRPADFVSEFAVTMKNEIRQRGASRLGWPCLLTGSGMAFPWYVLSVAQLRSGNIVEDMQLSFDLLARGYPTTFCPSAVVTAPLPRLRSAALSQRTRWEHGHLLTLLHQVPRLMGRALVSGNWRSICAALDLAIPPLSLVAAWWLATFLVALAGWASSQIWWPVWVLGIAGLVWGIMLIAMLLIFGRPGTLTATLITVPRYVWSKLPIYTRFLVQPQRAWLRTERDGAR